MVIQRFQMLPAKPFVALSAALILSACAPVLSPFQSARSEAVQKQAVDPLAAFPAPAFEEAAGAPLEPILAAYQGDPSPALHPGETPEVRKLVNKWADHYDVPRSLVHRVIQRESDYRAGARNGPYYGMMQILPATARSMGFSGEPNDLLNADTNLKYAVKYLRGALLVSDGSEKQAVQWYARCYYYEARNRCMLRETGLRSTEVRKYCA